MNKFLNLDHEQFKQI